MIKASARAHCAWLAQCGSSHPRTLVLEIKGDDSPQNRAKRDALGEWVAAVNSVGGFGRWCCDVAFEPAKIQDIIAKHAA